MGKEFGGKVMNMGLNFIDTGCSAAIGPYLHHFRSTTTIEIQAELLHCWEECCEKETPLPAKEIHHYIIGSLVNIDTHDNQPRPTGNEVGTVKFMTENDVPRLPQKWSIQYAPHQNRMRNKHKTLMWVTPQRKQLHWKPTKHPWVMQLVSYLLMNIFWSLMTFDNA